MDLAFVVSLLKVGAAIVGVGLVGALMTAIHLASRLGLQRLRARPSAVRLLDLAAVIAGVSFVVWASSGSGLAAWVAAVAAVSWLVASARPAALIRLSGGPMPTGAGELLDAVEESDRVLRRGEIGQWVVAMREMRAWRTERTARLVDALQALADDGERGFARDATREHLREIERARDELLGIPGPGRRRLAVLIVCVVAAAPGGLLLTRFDPCIGAEWQLAGTRVHAQPRATSLPNLLPSAADMGAAPAQQSYLTLADAVAVKYDPRTQGQLEEAGFVSGYQAGWLLDDGHIASADVFEFRTPEGAMAYQRAVTRYACGFATEEFDDAGGGLGLRIRYRTGDPFADQLSWVDGTYRIVVSRTFGEQPPADHAYVIRMAEATRDRR